MIASLKPPLQPRAMPAKSQRREHRTALAVLQREDGARAGEPSGRGRCEVGGRVLIAGLLRTAVSTPNPRDCIY